MAVYPGRHTVPKTSPRRLNPASSANHRQVVLICCGPSVVSLTYHGEDAVSHRPKPKVLRTMYRYDVSEIKLAMKGREVDVLENVANIPAELLDGHGHGCPGCGAGKNRFRLLDRGRGAVLCNQCFNKKNGDAISAVRHFRNVKMEKALELIGQYLGVAPASPESRGKCPISKSRGANSRTTKPTRATKPARDAAGELQGTATSSTGESISGESRRGDQCEVWHEIYSIVLSGLELSDAHRKDLHQRGLTDRTIHSGEYRSVVAPSRTAKSTRMLKAWLDEGPATRRELVLTVPGVIQDGGKPIRFSSPCGLLIPVRNLTGQIVALRIRPDVPGEGGKYRWISSRSQVHPNHPSPGTPCHVPCGILGPVEVLRITEGELKADIAFRLSGIPTLSIPGVSLWKLVLPLIEELKPKAVLIGLDADCSTNIAVANALQGLVTMLSSRFDVAVETWQPNAGKGIDDLLASGGSPTVLRADNLQSLLAELPVSARANNAVDRTEIIVGTDEHRVNDAAVTAMAGDDGLFVRTGMLTRIVNEDAVLDGIVRAKGAKRISVVPPQSLRETMTRHIEFIQEKTTPHGEIVVKPIHPPAWCVSAVHARGTWPGIRPLRAIVTCPTLRPDGSIMSTNGYDPITGLYLSSSVDLPPIPAKPTRNDAVLACDVLLSVVVDFPFAKPEHRAAWLAFALTPLARYAFSGPSPLFLIDANTRGSGKSLLADVCGIIATGTTMARMSNPKDDDECRKRITALAIAGDSLVLIDNVIGDLGCASLDAALTAPDSWKDRILGKSEMVDLPLSLTWAATGNNMMLAADTSRRSLHIRLDSPLENPELRTGFKNLHLIEHVKSQRTNLVGAALTILSAYHAAGRPRMDLPAWGSFDAWSALVREAVVWCGLPDPGKTREELAKRSDVIAGILQVLINQWQSIDADGAGLTSSELLKRLREGRPEHEAIIEAICELCRVGEKLPSPRCLGNRLKKVCGRVINGMALDSDPQHGMARWVVRPVKKPDSGCSGWSGGSPPRVKARIDSFCSAQDPEQLRNAT